MKLSLPKRFFVTGTDTEVGKTYCSALITRFLTKQGKSVFPFKPIAAGTEANPNFNNDKVNEDAAKLYEACNGAFKLEQINPILFNEAIAPHIAAKIHGDRISITRLNQAYIQIPNTEYALIEGAGGWLLPLNEKELMSQWVVEQKLPVVMVVGVKLGCLNHALLTAQSILQSGGILHGWVANFVEPENEISRENVEYLKTKLNELYNAPCLFEVQYGQEQLQELEF